MESSQQPSKKMWLSGGARRILKKKENSIKGNSSILTFLQPPVSKSVELDEEDNTYFSVSVQGNYVIFN